VIDVVGELVDAVVSMRCGDADARAFHRDDPDVSLVCRLARLGRDLPTRTRRTVEPDQRSSGDRAELGVAELATVLENDGAFEAGREEGGHEVSPISVDRAGRG